MEHWVRSGELQSPRFTSALSGIKKRRRGILTTIALFAVAGYLLLLLGSRHTDLPQERRFSTGSSTASRVQLYVEIVSIDPVRSAMQVQLTIEPTGLGMDPRSMLPDRDLMLVVEHDKREQRIEIHAHQPLPTTPVEVDLDGGDVIDYPLDAYHADLSIRCFEGSALTGPQPKLLPIDVTIWERVLGFRLKTGEQTGRAAGEDRLTFQIRRSFASTFFAFAIYGAMTVLAGVALTVGSLTFLGVRRPDAALVGALGAIVFAMPALRNALPGGAPLGILADVFIYLWAELAVVCALVLLIATWARSGPPP